MTKTIVSARYPQGFVNRDIPRPKSKQHTLPIKIHKNIVIEWLRSPNAWEIYRDMFWNSGIGDNPDAVADALETHPGGGFLTTRCAILIPTFFTCGTSLDRPIRSRCRITEWFVRACVAVSAIVVGLRRILKQWDPK